MTNFTHIAILDTNAGHLQVIGQYADADAAFAALQDEIGGSEPIDRDAYSVHAMTADEADSVIHWWDGGADAATAPACLSR